MFCHACHWYNRGEAVCPHCGAPQQPEEGIVGLASDASDASVLAFPAPPEPPPAPISKPAPLPKPMPPPAPKPAPVPMPKPAPAPVPKPAPYVPKPAPKPAPDSGKQGLKALAIVLAGVFALVLVVIIADQAGRDSSYEYNYYEHNNIYDDDPWLEMTTAAPLEEAWPGDVVLFGSAQWRVLDEDPPDALLLLLDYEIILPHEETNDYPLTEMLGDTVVMGGVEFSVEEYIRIQHMFLPTPEELVEYGYDPPVDWDADDGFVPVRPAIWVNVQ